MLFFKNKILILIWLFLVKRGLFPKGVHGSLVYYNCTKFQILLRVICRDIDRSVNFVLVSVTKWRHMHVICIGEKPEYRERHKILKNRKRLTSLLFRNYILLRSKLDRWFPWGSDTNLIYIINIILYLTIPRFQV